MLGIGAAANAEEAGYSVPAMQQLGMGRFAMFGLR
jgi:hypothetical protein